jgi:hypothetical protein
MKVCNDPDSELHGKKYLEFLHNNTDKVVKLSLMTPYKRQVDSMQGESTVYEHEDDPISTYKLFDQMVNVYMPHGHKGFLFLKKLPSDEILNKRYSILKGSPQGEVNVDGSLLSIQADISRPINERDVNTICNKIAHRANFENAWRFTARSCRKLAITMMGSSGVAQCELQGHARHSSTKMTGVYQFCTAKTLKQRVDCFQGPAAAFLNKQKMGTLNTDPTLEDGTMPVELVSESCEEKPRGPGTVNYGQITYNSYNDQARHVNPTNQVPERTTTYKTTNPNPYSRVKSTPSTVPVHHPTGLACKISTSNPYSHFKSTGTLQVRHPGDPKIMNRQKDALENRKVRFSEEYARSPVPEVPTHYVENHYQMSPVDEAPCHYENSEEFFNNENGWDMQPVDEVPAMYEDHREDFYNGKGNEWCHVEEVPDQYERFDQGNYEFGSGNNWNQTRHVPHAMVEPPTLQKHASPKYSEPRHQYSHYGNNGQNGVRHYGCQGRAPSTHHVPPRPVTKIVNPYAKKPQASRPAMQNPYAKKPPASYSAIQNPYAKKPPVSYSAIQNPYAKKPAVSRPAMQNPYAKKPPVSRPPIHNPYAKKPTVSRPPSQYPPGFRFYDPEYYAKYGYQNDI